MTWWCARSPRAAPPSGTTVAGARGDDLVTVTPEDGPDHAIEIMREHAVRHVPVVESGHPTGMVALAGLARERDPESAPGDISAARPTT